MTSRLALSTVLLAACAAPAPELLSDGAVVGGQSLGDWAATWWTAQMADPFEENWASDPTGERCALHQEGAADVWMLAGIFWGADPAVRTCTVPEGAAILVPVSNYFDDFPCPDPTWAPAEGQSLEDFLVADATAFMATTTAGSVTFDGESYDAMDHFVTSDLVTFAGDVSWQAGDPCVTGEEQSAVSAGYYLMFAPPSPGEHTVAWTASGDEGTLVDATYTLTVE